MTEFILINGRCMVYGHDFDEDGNCKRLNCGGGKEMNYEQSFCNKCWTIYLKKLGHSCE